MYIGKIIPPIQFGIARNEGGKSLAYKIKLPNNNPPKCGYEIRYMTRIPIPVQENQTTDLIEGVIQDDTKSAYNFSAVTVYDKWEVEREEDNNET